MAISARALCDALNFFVVCLSSGVWRAGRVHSDRPSPPSRRSPSVAGGRVRGASHALACAACACACAACAGSAVCDASPATLREESMGSKPLLAQHVMLDSR